MTDTTIQQSRPHLMVNIFMILFMGWASFEAFHDHKPLSAIAYISFSLAFAADAFQIRQRNPYGKFIYYSLIAIAVILGFFSIFRRLVTA